MSGLSGVAEVSNDLAAAQEIVEVTVDRKAAAEYGLTETQVTGIASAAMTGSQEMGELHTAEGPVGRHALRRRRPDHDVRDRGDPGPDGGRRRAAERRREREGRQDADVDQPDRRRPVGHGVRDARR